MASPTVDWERVGDRYYRKTKLYDAVFDEDLELENYVIAGAPYGGALGKWSPLVFVLPLLTDLRSSLSRRREAIGLSSVEINKVSH